MTRAKSDVRRPYAPDFVSAETLAYRLDFGKSKIDEMVSSGELPKPLPIGGHPRWSWDDVVRHIAARAGIGLNASGDEQIADDPFISGAKRAAANH